MQRAVSFAIGKVDYITSYKKVMNLGFCNLVYRIKDHL